MDEDTRDLVESRLAVFDEEPDINDWVEVFSGALMAMIGIYFLLNPEGTIRTEVMQWFASAVIAVGAVWAGHGLKDMAVKEVRRSYAVMEATGRADSIDYGLIRDVLMHPGQYRSFLLEAYEKAYDDGVITDEELVELKSLQEILGISDEEAAAVATRAAINSAIRDGDVNADELVLITDAAEAAGLSEKDIQDITKALEDHKLDDEETAMLNDILGSLD